MARPTRANTLVDWHAELRMFEEIPHEGYRVNTYSVVAAAPTLLLEHAISLTWRPPLRGRRRLRRSPSAAAQIVHRAQVRCVSTMARPRPAPLVPELVLPRANGLLSVSMSAAGF